MESTTYIVSILAMLIGCLLVVGFGVFLQLDIHGKSTDQLVASERLLAKLEGIALQLRETPQGQSRPHAPLADSRRNDRPALREVQPDEDVEMIKDAIRNG
jgi:hypothetical protein